MRSRWFGPTLAVDTPAKLNLQLSVLGRRPDGFHELETIMVSIGLYDTLTFAPGPSGVSFTCNGAAGPLPADESNLVLRAARRLLRPDQRQPGVQIHLTKRIPMQAGMGGGSSDAAATLVALNDYWHCGLSQAELHAHAAALGSDVNFFVDSSPLALCRGRGEQIESRSLSGPLWFVVAKPPVGLSTAVVFRQLDLATCGRADSHSLLQACQRGNLGAIAARLTNDLETPSRQLSSEIGDLLERLAAVRLAGPRMTGSGSACFGLARNREQADRAARCLRRQGVHEVYVVQTAV